MIKTLQTTLKQDKEQFKVPRSVQDIIPIRRLWPDGIFQFGSKYSKTLRFSDINYAIASKEDSESDILQGQGWRAMIKSSNGKENRGIRRSRFDMIAILLAPVYLLANYYLLRRVMGWVKAWFPFFRTARHWALPVAAQAFLACSVVIAFFLPEGELRRAMKLIGNYWLGVLLYVLLAVIAADLLRLLLGHVLPFKHIFVTTKMHRIAGCVCALVILGTSVWGVVNARIIHVTPYDMTVNKTVEGMDEMKVVLVADLHLGYNIGEKQMQQMVERINEQDADLVVIAGDIFDNEWEAVDKPETIAATLRGIQSKYGVYACYGNHDIEEPVLAGFTFRQSEKKESDPRMDEFLEDADITLLHDAGTLIDGKFYLYGRADAHRPGRGIETRKTPDEITAGLDKDKPIIVLDHQPKELQELADAGVDLDLCGHTHDGQMFPGNLTVRLMWENACGYLQKEQMHNIVTSGVGVFGPNMRVGTKAEICPITIHFANG